MLSGDDATQSAFRQAGGDGCISVAANVTPALCSALHRAFDRRDTAAVARLDRILAPLHAAMFLEANPIPVKRALHRLGLMEDGLRLPLTPLSSLADVQLEKVLQVALPAEEEEALRIVSSRPFIRPRAA